jgi:methylase of polypeptide subunit release factors
MTVADEGSGCSADALKLSMSHEPITGLDIAASSGVWGIGLAQASPQIQITAVDRPEASQVRDYRALRSQHTQALAHLDEIGLVAHLFEREELDRIHRQTHKLASVC